MTGGERVERVGILGGTLDPIHVGHVETALAAHRALALTRVILMPSRLPPHRPHNPSASMFHRFAMAALAVNGLSPLEVSDEELAAEGPSYTALTLERLASRGLAPSQIFFITGVDAFAEIDTWYRYPALLDLAHFVVISRPGVPVGVLGDRLPHVRGRLHEPARGTGEREGLSVFLVDTRTPDVSSTDIRRRLRGGESISGLVPDAVAAHILRHGLYMDTPTADHLQR